MRTTGKPHQPSPRFFLSTLLLTNPGKGSECGDEKSGQEKKINVWRTTQRPPAQKGRKKVIKQQLCAQTSRETGYTLDEIEEIFSTSINIVLRTLSTGEAVKISDFGRFSLSKTGRLVFHPYLLTKKIIKGEAAAPAEPQTLYKVRRTKVKNSFKVEAESAAPREIRRISVAERVDYGELVEE